MGFIRTTTLIMALVFTFSTLQEISAKPILNNFKDNVKHLLGITGVENEYIRFLTYMKVYPPENNIQMKKLYEELFSHDSYVSDLIQVYAKYYTLDDITKLIHFYSSPLGKKHLQVNHELNRQMEDIMLTKISDYIFTSTEHGIDISLPQITK
jgi:hypothetical protein